MSMNESKTKYMAENVESGYIQSLSGKYIGNLRTSTIWDQG